MASISSSRHEKCPRCGSDERVTAQEVQNLWHCWNCKNEFITVATPDEKELSVTEITEPFFTSLVME